MSIKEALEMGMARSAMMEWGAITAIVKKVQKEAIVYSVLLFMPFATRSYLTPCKRRDSWNEAYF